MPADPAKKVERFLGRLRRRRWGLRVVEGGGVGLLIAAAAGIAAVALLYQRHQSAEFAVVALLAAGVAAGGLVGLARRPRMLPVAIEADRQLQLPELLSSAAMLPPGAAGNARDRELRLVLAERAARMCIGKSARRIRLRRFGFNRWGAIALSAAVPLLLGTLISPMAPAAPAAGDADRAAAESATDNTLLIQLADSSASGRMEMSTQEPGRPGLAPNDPPASAPPAPDPSGDGGHHADSASTGQNSGDANGGGSARTKVDQPPTAIHPDVTVGQSPPPGGSGTVTGGAGPSANSGPGHDGGNAGGGGRMIDANRAPPWESAGWAADADAARRQADAGQIPSAYRDLVRDYFSPDSQ